MRINAIELAMAEHKGPVAPAPAKPTPSVKEQIEYEVTRNSDFSFEMSVLHSLSSQGFDCEHSGTYVDPNTSKNREFDIRATKMIDRNRKLWLAVECKNIQARPLVIHRVPRRTNESFHDLLLATQRTHSTSDERGSYHPPFRGHMSSAETPYRQDLHVGKAMDQLVPQKNGGTTLNDKEVFEKLTQSLTSIAEMIDEACRFPKDQVCHALLPVLVVPSESLWTVDYSSKGEPLGPPTQVDHVQYFIGKSYPFFSAKMLQEDFMVSHMEVVTPKGIYEMLSWYCSGKEHFGPLFPPMGSPQ